jgi:hypothetical protein
MMDDHRSSDQGVAHAMTEIGPPDDGDQEAERAFQDRFVALVGQRRLAEAADLLRSEIAGQADPVVQLIRMGDLAMVLELNGQPADALATLHQRVEFAPDEPVGWCALANWHLRNDGDRTSGKPNRETALEVIDRAVAVAERTGGAWLRHCLNDRARIAKATGRWDVVEDTVRRILAIPEDRGVPDTAIEMDFLREVPPGAVDPELIRHLQGKHAAASRRRDVRQDP